MVNILISESVLQPKDKKDDYHLLTSYGTNFVDIIYNNYENKIIKSTLCENRREQMPYLIKLTSQIINDLSFFLNDIHKKNFSTRYWQILTGHIVNSLSINLYYYYCQYEVLFSKYPESEKFKLIINKGNISFDFNDRNDFFINSLSEEYQSYLATLVIKYFNKEVFIEDRANKIQQIKYSQKKINLKRIFYRVSTYIYARINNIQFYQISSFNIVYIKLHLRFKQFPLFFNDNWDIKSKSNNDLTIKRNSFLYSKIKINNTFENILRSELINLLPNQIIEDYEFYSLKSLNFYSKKKPKYIFLSNFIAPPLLLEHIAISAENYKTKLILLQHGGAYGIMDTFWQQNHDIDCSDKYLSWGWKLNNIKKVFKFSSFRMYSLKLMRKKNENREGIIIYALSNSKVPYEIISSYTGPDEINYLSSIKLFSESLDDKIKNIINIRIHPSFLDKNNVNFWKFAFPKSNVNINNLKNGYELMLSSKLVVVTYNATVILEALTLNIPVIAFWDFNILLMTNEAISFHQSLIDANILFLTPEAAAKQINLIYDKIDDWWNSEKVQNAISIFLSTYANTNNPINNLNSIVKNYSND
jgi:putative transferase (TIGR04331 family)